VRRARINQGQAIEFLEEVLNLAKQIIPANSFLREAHALSLRINHPVYDCLYAIAARENGATLVTCDTKFTAKLDAAIYQVRVV
jgi:predicted nucleic acid-binding protein